MAASAGCACTVRWRERLWIFSPTLWEGIEGRVFERDKMIQRLNSITAAECQNELLKCCGSKNWAARLVAERPFKNVEQLIETSGRIWWSLGPQDWLEAFRSHPKIGEQKTEAAASEQSRRWSENEQAGVADAANKTLLELAGLNKRYEQEFGYIFIVCATGKSSKEMLAILRDRLGNEPEQELRIAAAEQAKITALRLRKLIRT